MYRLIAPLLFMMVVSCKPPVQEYIKPEPDPVSEQFVKVNQYMQRRHQDHIAAFVDRVGWEAKTTPSGLWIVMEDEGSGKKINERDRVTYTFSSMLLDGTPCYEASDHHPKQIVVGRGGVEAGVEEGFKHLREGSRALFLIPPHLGHGNFGDRDKIPGNSVLIFKIEVKEVHRGM